METIAKYFINQQNIQEGKKKEYYKHGGYNIKKCKKCVAKTNKEKHLELKRKKENGIKFFQ